MLITELPTNSKPLIWGEEGGEGLAEDCKERDVKEMLLINYVLKNGCLEVVVFDKLLGFFETA